jgi:hypothetical protein
LRKLADVTLSYWFSAGWAVMHRSLDVPINLLKLIGQSVAKNRVKRYVATSCIRHIKKALGEIF